MTQNTKTGNSTAVLRWSVIAAVALVALFGSYLFAQARGGTARAAVAPAAVGIVSPATSSASAGAGGCCGSAGSSAAAGSTSGGSTSGGCCGGSGTAAPASSKKATVTGKLQKVSVDLSKGYFDPNTIELKAGVPAEITFGQGSGCLSQVQSRQLGFFQDLTQGPVTIKLPALAAGTYAFTCGMNMQSGSIVVK
jgi:hypothetical protein